MINSKEQITSNNAFFVREIDVRRYSIVKTLILYFVNFERLSECLSQIYKYSFVDLRQISSHTFNIWNHTRTNVVIFFVKKE
jgi:hypothetical protein